MDRTKAVLELEEAAKQYAALQEARDKSLTRLQEAIRAADRERAVSRAEIIRLSGVARQTVYDALRGQDPGPGR